MEHTVYVFDGFQLDVTRRQLCAMGGVVQPLNSRAMDTLLLLVAQAGKVIEKRRLIQAVWPAAVVEDNNLNQCILAIRRALGETAGTNRYVMTVPGRGYCFVCPVRTVTSESIIENAASPTGWRARAAWIGVGALAGMASLLLWIGMHPDAATGLARTRTMADAGNMMMRLRPLIPSQRGDATAAMLSDCLVQRSELHLQIEVRLIDPGARTEVWTGLYVADAGDVVAQQSPPRAPAGACERLTAQD